MKLTNVFDLKVNVDDSYISLWDQSSTFEFEFELKAQKELNQSCLRSRLKFTVGGD